MNPVAQSLISMLRPQRTPPEGMASLAPSQIWLTQDLAQQLGREGIEEVKKAGIEVFSQWGGRL